MSAFDPDPGEVIDIGPATDYAGATPLAVRGYRAALLATGALIAGVAWILAGWLVGLFSTLPLPPGTRAGLTIAGVVAGAYYLAIDTDDDGATRLDRVLGWSA